MNGHEQASGGSPFGEERVDVRRYLFALRRSRWLIAAIVLGLTGLVLGISLALPSKYQAEATIVQEDIASPLGTASAETAQRELLTTAALLGTNRVLAAAARTTPGETALSLDDKVESSVDEQANIIEVAATDEEPRRAAAIASAVARAFLSERQELERRRIESARQSLLQEVERLRGTPNADAEIGAIRERVSELGVQLAGAGSDLQLAQDAEVPASPSAPRPLRNSLLALFAGIFLGVLVALGRDQLVPRVGDSRDLSRLTDVPVMIEVPYVRGRIGRKASLLTAAENEAYQSLRAAVEVALPPSEQRVILVSSAVHAEGKTTVTARLGRALAEAGHSTLLISADLRRPELHTHFGVRVEAGFCDVLSVFHQDPSAFDVSMLEAIVAPVPLQGRGRRQPGRLDLLTSGTKVSAPARLLSHETMRRFVDMLPDLDYSYVLFDGPPLLGIADSQVTAQEVHELLLVARLDRLTLENVSDLRDALARTGRRALGLVVIGGRSEMSPYYLPTPPAPERAGERVT